MHTDPGRMIRMNTFVCGLLSDSRKKETKEWFLILFDPLEVIL